MNTAVTPAERAALLLAWDAHLLRISLGLLPRSPIPEDHSPRVRPHRFRVSATRADGITTEYDAIGGTSCGHIADAIDLAGLGGVVRVQPVHQPA